MTAADRLKQLSGLAGVSAAAMLLSLGAGGVAGEILATSSGLPLGTAAEHLLAERKTPVQESDPKEPPTPSSAGGTGEGGRGYVLRDHVWVKGVKFATRSQIASYSGKFASATAATAKTKVLTLSDFRGDVSSKTLQILAAKVVHVVQPAGLTGAYSDTTLVSANIRTNCYNGACETLSLDELMTLLDIAA